MKVVKLPEICDTSYDGVTRWRINVNKDIPWLWSKRNRTSGNKIGSRFRLLFGSIAHRSNRFSAHIFDVDRGEFVSHFDSRNTADISDRKRQIDHAITGFDRRFRSQPWSLSETYLFFHHADLVLGRARLLLQFRELSIESLRCLRRINGGSPHLSGNEFSLGRHLTKLLFVNPQREYQGDECQKIETDCPSFCLSEFRGQFLRYVPVLLGALAGLCSHFILCCSRARWNICSRIVIGRFGWCCAIAIVWHAVDS